MKKIISILLIAAFFVQSTSQLWILASFKINQAYIASTLCINRFDAVAVCKGSCYLENQLNQDQKQQAKFPDLKTKEINLFCQYHSNELQKLVFTSNNVSYPNLNTYFISSVYLSSVFHPPSQAV